MLAGAARARQFTGAGDAADSGRDACSVGVRRAAVCISFQWWECDGPSDSARTSSDLCTPCRSARWPSFAQVDGDRVASQRVTAPVGDVTGDFWSSSSQGLPGCRSGGRLLHRVGCSDCSCFSRMTGLPDCFGIELGTCSRARQRWLPSTITVAP